jgi:putative sporulation protein YtxC
MLLLTIIQHKFREDVAEEIGKLKEYFKSKNVVIGISESIEEDTHFIKIFCNDLDYNNKLISMFNIYMANILYGIVIDEFYKKEMQNFLEDTYFFLKYEEIVEVTRLGAKALKSEGAILDESMVYCINRKNAIIEKITKCIEEYKEINIKGFITFRMREFREDLESIIDKVVENYMVEKEYNEFIKLLKYFVEIQESKIDEVNIIFNENGDYLIQDNNGEDILSKLTSELSEARYTGTVCIEDMLISGLITNCPKKIVIHCSHNCLNSELLETIKNVFLDRVIFCTSCKMCKHIKSTIKV